MQIDTCMYMYTHNHPPSVDSSYGLLPLISQELALIRQAQQEAVAEFDMQRQQWLEEDGIPTSVFLAGSAEQPPEVS